MAATSRNFDSNQPTLSGGPLESITHASPRSLAPTAQASKTVGNPATSQNYFAPQIDNFDIHLGFESRRDSTQQWS
jgi:hypothetical protein